MDSNRASIRQEVRIGRPAAEVWSLVGDPARVQEWFPGIESSRIEGDERVVTTAGGQTIRETIVTLDPLQRRFQYVLNLPLVRSHLATLDVIATGADECLVVYGTDAEPATLALTLSGATGAALDNLRAILEGV